MPITRSRTISIAGHVLNFTPGRGHTSGSWTCRRCAQGGRYVHAFASVPCAGSPTLVESPSGQLSPRTASDQAELAVTDA